MPQSVTIDDTNTTLITYQGDWTLLVGSSRQWNSTVHTTLTPKSSATFRFRGYQVWIWGTIPAGSGTSLFDISVDGSIPNVTSRTSNGSAVYEESFYESPLLRDTYHEIVITNQGSNTNGNSEFMLDRFEFETTDEVPLFTTPGFTVITSSTTSSSSSTATSTHSTSTPAGGGKRTPVGAIAGAVIGVLVFVIAILSYLLWRKSRRSRVVEVSPNHHPPGEQNTETSNGTAPRNPLLPIPYQLDSKPVVNTSASDSPLTESNTLARELSMSEKLGYRNFQPDGSMLASSSSLIGNLSPMPRATSSLRTSNSNRDDQSHTPSSPNDGSSSSMYYPHSPQRQAIPIPLGPLAEVMSSTGENLEQPPPSYSDQEASASSVLSYK